MTTPAEQSCYHAVNEYIAAFVERHGECQATRDEAHDEISQYRSTAKEAVRLARSHRITSDVQDAAEELARILLGGSWLSDEFKLTCHMIAVEVEKGS